MDKAPDAFRTISEVAEDLDLPQHVLRFWETRFSQIKPLKRGGGRRYYRPDDIDLLRGIRHLLYGKGYTIKGVQRILKDEGVKFVQSVWKEGAPAPQSVPQPLPGAATDDDAIDTADELPTAPDDPAADLEDHDEGEPLTPLTARDFPTMRAAQLGNTEPPRETPVPARPISPPTERQPALKPLAQAVRTVSLQQSQPAATVTETGVRRLQAALYELGECRRVLANARAAGEG